MKKRQRKPKHRHIVVGWKLEHNGDWLFSVGFPSEDAETITVACEDIMPLHEVGDWFERTNNPFFGHLINRSYNETTAENGYNSPK
jgi:hypothetical protein